MKQKQWQVHTCEEHETELMSHWLPQHEFVAMQQHAKIENRWVLLLYCSGTICLGLTFCVNCFWFMHVWNIAWIILEWLTYTELNNSNGMWALEWHCEKSMMPTVPCKVYANGFMTFGYVCFCPTNATTRCGYVPGSCFSCTLKHSLTWLTLYVMGTSMKNEIQEM